ncbi:MAG: hypothetical protein L0Y56_20315, partial [Nitrospira sp.]|nr:hypothetical protein [Nitrospira sp.]
ITTPTPTYTWNKISNATWYLLWVDGPSGNVIQTWYESSTICSTSTCSVTPSTTLVNGTHSWKVRTWNSSGNGPWSSVLNFTVNASSLPGRATLISPSGIITTSTPTYQWNKVSNSTWYYLWVNGPSGNPVIQQWYQGSVVCSGSICSVTPTTTLGSGSYTWWIQTWNSAGFGPWSLGMSFTR